MVKLLHGKGVGSGKSYWLVSQVLLPHFYRGGTAFVSSSVGVKWPEMKALAEREGYALKDEQLVTFDTKDAAGIHRELLLGTPDNPVLLILDEAQGPLNARDWADSAKRAFFEWLCQSRHDGVDVYISTQHLDNVDKQVRRVITEIHTTQDMKQIRFLGFISYRADTFRHAIWSPDYKTQVTAPTYIKKEQRYYDIYDTHACRGAHREVNIEAKKHDVKIKKPKMKLSRIIVLAVLVLILVAAYAWHKAKSYMEKKTKPPHAETRSAVSATSPSEKTAASPPRFRIATDLRDRPPLPRLPETRAEVLLGTDSYSFLRTDAGAYYRGQIGAFGMCLEVKYRAALIRKFDGNLLMIVAIDKEKSPSPLNEQTNNTNKQTTQTKQ